MWITDFISQLIASVKTKNELIIFISAPIQTVLIISEMILSKLQHKRYYNVKDTAINVYLMLLNLSLDILMLAILTTPVLAFFYEYQFFQIQNPIMYWFVLLIAEDFMFYWEHYFDHHSRFFWATHSTHHSSDFYNLTVGFRSSVFQPIYRFIYFIPLALCGFKVLDIMFMYSITQIYGILIHTRHVGKLGFLEYFLATPSHHRVHHASNTKYLDKNMGMVFIFWDKMFGTFQPELTTAEYEELEYGLTKKIPQPGPINTVFYEWILLLNDLKRKVDFKTKLKYVFFPPGWSHDGSTKTSKQLQKELDNNQ